VSSSFERLSVVTRVAFVSLAAVLVGSFGGALAGAAADGLPAAYAYGVEAAVASLAIGAVAVVTARAAGVGFEFFSVRRPSARTLGWGVLAGVAMLALLWVFGVVTSALDVPSASHGVVSRIEANPTIALVMVVVSIVAVAPGEELLARGFVQGSLYRVYPDWMAVVVASAVFAAVHVFAYWTAPAAAVVASLLQLFVISLVLGWVYVRTRNLVAAVVAHAVYDAVQFAFAYITYGPV